MDTGRNDLLGEIAADAALERSDFLVQSTDQLRRFLDRHKERLAALRRPDAHRRGARLPLDRARPLVPQPQPVPGRDDRRVGQRDRGHRVRVRARRAVQPGRHLRRLRRGRPRGGRATAEAPTAADDLLEVAGISPEETITLGEDPYAAAADSWAAGQGDAPALEDDEAAARRLYDLALEYQERSQRSESRLLDEFEVAAAGASGLLGDLVIVDDDDERLVLTAAGEFRAEVVPEEADGAWRTLSGADELVEFYDPTDVFGDLADALAEAYPAVAPEYAGVPQLTPQGGRGRGRGRRRRRRGRGGRRGRRGRGGRRGRRATTPKDAEDRPTA